MSTHSWRGAAWEVGLEHYHDYIGQSGTSAISVDYVCADGFRLGRWVNTQRVHRRSERLKPERFKILDDLGLQWDPSADLQRSMIEALSEFRRREGHAEVPAAYRTDDGISLGNWLRTQRARYAKGVLDPKLIAELQSLGVTWENRFDTRYEQGLAELAKYVESNASSHVPSSYVTPSGFALGQWFTLQKYAMTRDMPPERQERLEALGVRPDHDVREEAWQSSFEVFASWVRQHGHANPTRDYANESGVKLGPWLSLQRAWLRSGRLKENRRLQLDSLLPGWDTAKPKWTTAEALGALRTAATMAFPLSASEYTDLRVQRLVIGPSHAWFIQRFKTWSSACEAADVEPGPSGEGWTPYSQADVSQALVDFFDAHDDNATSDNYASWAQQNGAPSIGTVMRRYGIWTEIRRQFGSAVPDEPVDG